LNGKKKPVPPGGGISGRCSMSMAFACEDGSTVTVRNDLRPGDLGSIIRQHGVLYSKECGFDVSIEIYVAGPLSVFAGNRGDRQRIWIVEQKDSFLGSAAVAEHSREEAQLRWLLLDPAARGMGIGRRLVEEAVRFARETGYRSIFLWTVHILPMAARIYRDAGFRLTAEKEVFQWGRPLREQRYDLPLYPGDERSMPATETEGAPV